MKADEFLDEAPSADAFLGDEPLAVKPVKRPAVSRGNSLRPVRTESVLQQPGNAEAFAVAPDPRANAEALFKAVQNNPDLIKSPMYAPGAAILERQVSGQPSPVQSAVDRNRRDQMNRASRQKQLQRTREQTDEAFGLNPVMQALAAPGRRLASGVATVIGGAAGIPQLFGSDLGSETSAAMGNMAQAHMPADPGLADEVLQGVGQMGPMVGAGGAARTALTRLLGERAATGIATAGMGGVGGAMTGDQVLGDLEFRSDLSEGEKQRRAMLAALFSAVTGKYADRFLLPGADKATTGAMQAGRRALFAEGAQEGLDQVGQNIATDRPVGEGVGHAALVGGLVGGGTRVAGEVNSMPYQLADAINADSQAFADRAPPQVVQQPVARAVGAPLAPPAPGPAPVAPPPAALPYDPAVKNAPGIMVADAAGAVRPMTADEFLLAEDTKQQGIDTGLTPDVRRAQENRSEVTDVEPKPAPDLLKRLIASGWTPPENLNASSEPAPAAPDQAATQDRAAPAGDTRPDGADRQDGARVGQPDAALTHPAAAPVAQVTANTEPAAAPAQKPAALDLYHGTKDPQVTVGTLTKSQDIGPHFTTARGTADLFANSEGTPGRVLKARGEFANTLELPDLHGWYPTNMAEAIDKANDIPVGADGQSPLQARVWSAMEKVRLEHLEAQPEWYQRARNDFGKKSDEQTAKERAVLDAAREKANEAGYQILRDHLNERGVDAIKYVNRSEGEPVDTYIALDHSKLQDASDEAAATETPPGAAPAEQDAPAAPVAAKQEAEPTAGQVRRETADAMNSEGGGGASTADTVRAELRERFGDVIDRLEKRGFLKVWDSVADYNAAGQYSQLPVEASGGVQGMYSHKTGVAHLFSDGIQLETAVGVLLHEVGEHASMKAMLGDKRYTDLVRRAHQLVAGGDEIAETAMMRIPDDTPRQFFDSELVAYMIEETANREGKASPGARKWLADALAAIRAWFYQTGFAKKLEGYGVELDLTPKDIAALAERAVRWQAEQGVDTRPTGEPEMAFSRKPPVSPTGSNLNNIASAAQPWSVAEPGTWDNVVRAMQNNKIDLKRVRESIEERFGRIPDAADAYLQEELYHGKVSARVQKLHTEAVEPILRKIAVAAESHGVTVDDVNSYLHALHAPERNAAMAAINPNMANNTALSGMSDADAARVLADFAANGKAPALAAIAKDVHQLLADTRTALVADGLEEAGVVQAWEQAYQNYVPLMRDVENAPAKGQGVSVKGPEAKRAVGSNRQAVNILANVVTQAETAAIRAEKAEVGRSLLAMAQAYPNPDFWTVDTPPTKPRLNPQTGLVERSAVDPLYQTADNVVMVKDYGATRFVVFNKGNERAVQLAKAMKSLDVQQVPRAIEYIGKATRFMASLLTQRNPEFWFTNFSRDLQGSMLQMSGTEAEGLQAKVLGYLPKALAGMRHVARDTGKQTQWERYARELQDAGGTTGYMQQFENSDVRMTELQKEVDRMQQGKADPRRLARSMLAFIDDYNDVIENGMRLAVFQAARESGVSTERAASIAKNITVNFNRKGNATPLVNSLYMFFNAGLQGTARLTQALATSNKARIAVGSLATVAFIMDVVNRAMAGDDDETKRNRYDLIPENEKARNWIFMNPAKPGSYVKVPLPIGFNIFHNAGRLTADAIFRKDPRNAAEYGWAFASTLLDAFSPLGSFGSLGQMIAPSVLRPAVQMAENKNAFGSRVYKSADQGFGKVDPKPAYTRHFDSTPDFWKAASRTLSDASGGDKVKPGKINIEPDALRFIYTTMTGGPGRALDKGADTLQAKARGEDVSAARLPFAGRFYGANDDRQKDAAYYEDLKRAEKAKTQFDYFTKAGRRDLALEVLKELGNGEPAKGRQVIAEYERAKKDDRVINRRLRQLAETEGEDPSVTEQMSALKQRKKTGHRRVLSTTSGTDEE